MNNWAARRKSIILGGIVLILSAITFSIFWKFWYKAPTCFDNYKNGDETGIDCGGSCALLCREETQKPIVRWDPRLFRVSEGVWSAIVYVENPNLNADATYVPYSFTIYGDNNEILEQRKGATILPRNKTVGIFEGNILIPKDRAPRRAIFELSGAINWSRENKFGSELVVTHTPLLRLDTQPRIETTVRNNNPEAIRNIELVAAIFDGSDNVIAASRTFIEKLDKNSEQLVFFTWPRPFELGTKVCEEPSNTMLLLDRSGSMASLGQNPPQPLTDAKNAAASFVERLTMRDKVGVASFATEASNPIELPLTNNFVLAENAVNQVSIDATSTQYTNIFSALNTARTNLESLKSSSGNTEVVILLTDGVANFPKDPEGKTEADNIKYAEKAALDESYLAKESGITLYTIGLGKNLNESFLKQVATDENHYFHAPTAQELNSIYKNISSQICKEIPARIEITYKVFGDTAE